MINFVQYGGPLTASQTVMSSPCLIRLIMKDFSHDGEPVLFFHVCTDGETNGIVHTNDEDYRNAIIFSAVKAFLNNVRIIVFCHMSTHSHFVISCGSYEDAVNFIESFKRDFSRYISLKHGSSCVYRNVSSTPKLIQDSFYLKRCIAYVLLNPVVPKIVVRPEDYRWSSFNAYFRTGASRRDCIPVSRLTQREIRRIFHTHSDLTSSGFLVDSDRQLVIESVVCHSLVEHLFGGRTEFFKALALTDSVVEELTYVPRLVRYTDNEIFAEAAQLSASKFGTGKLNELTHKQKLVLLMPLKRKTGASATRLARVLRLNPAEVRRFFPQE